MPFGGASYTVSIGRSLVTKLQNQGTTAASKVTLPASSSKRPWQETMGTLVGKVAEFSSLIHLLRW